jgi:hypothetical protein
MKKWLMVLFCTMLITLILQVPSLAYGEGIDAKISDSKVFVNESYEVMQAYNIQGYNYFNLRDIASALRNTTSEFEVIWNEQKRSVEIITDKAYTPIGGEQKKSEKYRYAKATPCESKLYVDDKEVSIQA